ncbi:MAG: hypothetical protein ACE37H_00630 [Phycisphaeraceae bacterium]
MAPSLTARQSPAAGQRLRGAAAVFALAALTAGHARAQVQWTGAVYPAPTQTTLNDDLFVGYNTAGSLTIDDAGVVYDYYGYLGYYPFATGQATIDGPGSLWKHGRNLYVGYRGDATLTLQNGGRVESTYTTLGDQPGASGQVLVRGDGSTLVTTGSIEVANQGRAVLTIQQGGRVETNSVRIGRDASSHGRVVVEGTGSTLDGGVVLYGSTAPGPDLIIRDAGKLTNGDAYVGQADNGLNSHVLVDGPGSQWDADRFELGYAGTGEVLVEVKNGARLNTGNAQVGWQSVARVEVHGPASRWTAAQYIVGIESDADVYITGGAAATGTRGYIGNYIGDYRGAVTVRGAGSSWSLSQFMLLGVRDGAVGEINAIDGGRISVNQYLTINDASRVHVSVGHDALVAPISIGGDAQLAGELAVTPDAGAALADGQAFPVMSVGARRTGQFAGLDEGGVVDVWSGLALTITYAGGDGNDVWLHASAAMPGDLNASGLVDQADLDIVLNRFGQSVKPGHWTQGDADLDGVVGVSDLDAVLANWSNPANAPAYVPEPASCAVFALATALVCRPRRGPATRRPSQRPAT